jgi:hypothetical protein
VRVGLNGQECGLSSQATLLWRFHFPLAIFDLSLPEERGNTMTNDKSKMENEK